VVRLHIVAPDMSIEPIDCTMTHTVHHGHSLFAHEIRNEESSALGLKINWSKTKIQISCDVNNKPLTAPVFNDHLYAMNSFVYVGSCIHCSGGNDQDVQTKIELACTCMKPWTVESGIVYTSANQDKII